MLKSKSRTNTIQTADNKQSFIPSLTKLFTPKGKKLKKPIFPKPTTNKIDPKKADFITAYLLDSFTPELLGPEIKQFKHEAFDNIVMPDGYNIISLSKSSTKNEYPGILLYDIDDTLIKLNESEQSKTLIINEKPLILTEIQYAIKEGFLIGVLTAREYKETQFSNYYISAMNILENIGIDFFKFIIFTNHRYKDKPMIALSNHYNLPRRQLCLIDDCPLQIESCEKQLFNVVNVTQEYRHEKVLGFLSQNNVTASNEEKYLPSVETYENPSYAYPPPLERVIEGVEIETHIHLLNVINTSFKAGFIFTVEWLLEPIDIYIIDFLKTALANRFALILMTPEKYDEEVLQKYLIEEPLIANNFYCIGYTNENPCYRNLLKEIIKYTSIPPKNISFIGPVKETIFYGDIFGFNKISLSPAYVCSLSLFAKGYLEKNKLSEMKSELETPIETPVKQGCAI